MRYEYDVTVHYIWRHLSKVGNHPDFLFYNSIWSCFWHYHNAEGVYLISKERRGEMIFFRLFQLYICAIFINVKVF